MGKCCQTTGYHCFMKDTNSAKCMDGCIPGQDGWCTEVVNLKPVTSYPGLRFFCFAFYQADMGTTKPNYELSLYRTQLFLGASIFGCPKWVVYSDVDTCLSPGPPLLKTTKVYDVDGDFHILRRKDTGSYNNGMMFYQAWLDIRNKKLTADSDWVVKVDGDAVFLPQRLLDTLKGYKAPAGTSRWYPPTASTPSSPASRHASLPLTGRAWIRTGSTARTVRIFSCRSAWTRLGSTRFRTSLSPPMELARPICPRRCRRRRASSGRLTAQARSQLCCIPSRSPSITSRASQRRSARMKQIAGGCIDSDG